jgi:hypothetical protein
MRLLLQEVYVLSSEIIRHFIVSEEIMRHLGLLTQ